MGVPGWALGYELGHTRLCGTCLKETLVTWISSLHSMILALINDWGCSSVVGVSYTTVHSQGARDASIVLRTVTIAVYFFLFEQKDIFAVFLPYKLFKKTWIEFL